MFSHNYKLGKGGRTVYLGPISQAVNYFQNLGFRCEPGVNPADYLIDVTAGKIISNNYDAKDLATIWENQNDSNSFQVNNTNNNTFKTPRLSYCKSISFTVTLLINST